jgi:superoxide dismutase
MTTYKNFTPSGLYFQLSRSDKKKYLNEQWKIINWNVINTRWGQSL